MIDDGTNTRLALFFEEETTASCLKPISPGWMRPVLASYGKKQTGQAVKGGSPTSPEKAGAGDGRYKKIHEKSPKTPCQRLLESAEVSEESKAELMRRKNAYNPVELNSRLNRAIEGLLKLNGEKGKVKQASGQEAGQAEAV
jgi:hypothetical protein